VFATVFMPFAVWPDDIEHVSDTDVLFDKTSELNVFALPMIEIKFKELLLVAQLKISCCVTFVTIAATTLVVALVPELSRGCVNS
jgi:hypothetical protein